MHRFYAAPDTFNEGRVRLDQSETRHLSDVLRLSTGASVLVFDGEGREYECVLSTIGKNETELTIVSQRTASAPESDLDLTLAAAMLKGEKFDLVVQKAVELGVKNLVPLKTSRTDVRPKDALKRVERWRKIALEASKQSGRAFLMKVSEPVDLEQLIDNSEGSTIFMFSERDGSRLPDEIAGRNVTAIVGPEGGWDDLEIKAARKADICVVTFGGRTLRAETAAISMAAILQNRFGDLN